MLTDLAAMAAVMGLTVCGFDPRTGEWSTAEQLRDLVDRDLDHADRLWVRVYGTSDYHLRLRRYLEDRAVWRLPPIQCDESRQDPRLELLSQYLRDGYTQSDLAHELGVSQQRVSDVVSGKKPVPDSWLQQLE
jgi:hypothetical protein